MDVKQTLRIVGGKLVKALKAIARFFTPLEEFSPKVMRVYSFFLATIFLLCWTFLKLPFIPTFGEVLNAFAVLWKTRGLFDELSTSLMLNMIALATSTIIAFSLAYLYTIPGLRPIIRWLTKLRFLGFTGLVFIFTLYIGSGMELRFSLMLFAVTWFYLTALVAIVRNIPDYRYDHAYTLRMGPWRTVWEVVVLGTLADMLGTMVQFAAYGWAMLTAVEGLSRSKGGLGVMILNSDKYLKIPEIFAMVFTVLLLGMILDAVITFSIAKACPSAFLQSGRRL